MACLSLNTLGLHRFPPCLQIPQPLQFIANPLQRHKTHKIKTFACQTNPNLDESSTRVQRQEKSVAEPSSIRGTSPPKFPSKDIKKKIAVVSILAALGLFFSTRLNFDVSMKDHCVLALPFEEALSSGKPIVVEFYADWSEVCGESAPDVYKVEQQYK
ncbi:thioredoxin-like protein HCF164, chloroplastic [Abrus precatorius]|uniref:Thioredoxin-like protein HCF164, chloroplastic n=1 Tax=Abrus precatorius TaxID=3816 RepID=A0A8B8KVP0_ABRPR|nr:thioredoxin-like protein HCF164, chloroplastic [Abrus precatorius]